ncbi:MAG: DUF1638 domain-containing protein [Candidatus Omnitrophica bacterium]|nr:DUF1638 domain-containing protein [Candidatus Omnitrophota bacterium]
MGEDKFLLIGCGILKKEVLYLIGKNSWPLETVFFDSALHTDFEGLSHHLTSCLSHYSQRKTIVFYGACHPLMKNILEEAGTFRTAGQNCIEMLLGSTVFTEELSKGAFFLLEDWARSWDSVMNKTFGGNSEGMKEIFQEDRKYLLCLKTPCSGDFSSEAVEIGRKTGLPLVWRDVSLDNLESVLREAITRKTKELLPDETVVLKKEYEVLEHRLKKLAQEKSNLQLLITLMSELNAVSGLENTVEVLLRSAFNHVGGSNMCIYYYIGDAIYYADVFGKRVKLSGIEDPFVSEVFEERRGAIYEQESVDSSMKTSYFSKATTGAFPLMAGQDIIGVCKIEGIILPLQEMLEQFQVFFNYAAFILKNEIQGYSRFKKMNDQLIQSAKMASVGLLAGGVAHEINNPLSGVLNGAQLIKLMLEEKDWKVDEIKDLVNIIEESGKRCARITRLLLDFSRPPKGVSQKVSMNEVVEKVAELMEHNMSLENIIIKREFQPSIPDISGDPHLLQQVVFDIMTNAKWAIQEKSGKEGGIITILTRFDPGDKVVLVDISDSGIGISKENQNKIFSPFFTTRKVGEGTGLGLSIIYNIIKAHEGTIGFESEEGKGTTFKISLPAFIEKQSSGA